MAINHNDVYDFLHTIRKRTGVDLISQPKMVKMHGKTYPTIGNNLTLDTRDGFGSLHIHIPHENGYVTELHTAGGAKPLPDGSQRGQGSFLVNDMVPGTMKTQSGLIRPTFQPGTRGVNKTGPYYMTNGEGGKLTHAATDEESHIHDFLEHISGLPSPQGHAVNIYGREGNGPIPRDQMESVDLAGGIGHLREFHLGLTMPKGTEHHLGIRAIDEPMTGKPQDRYLYDIGSESLTKAPEEMHSKFGDVG